MAIQPAQLHEPVKQVQLYEQQTRSGSHQWATGLRRYVVRLVFNMVPFVIVGTFFWLQTRMNSQDILLNKIELGMSVIIELGLIFVWSLFLKDER